MVEETECLMLREWGIEYGTSCGDHRRGQAQRVANKCKWNDQHLRPSAYAGGGGEEGERLTAYGLARVPQRRFLITVVMTVIMTMVMTIITTIILYLYVCLGPITLIGTVRVVVNTMCFIYLKKYATHGIISLNPNSRVVNRTSTHLAYVRRARKT